MSLSDLLGTARQTPDYRRSKHNAKADRDLIARLVARRNALGLSQEALAERIGIKQQAVSKFEKYDSDPKLSTIRRYANAVDALVGHTVDEDSNQLEFGTVQAWSVFSSDIQVHSEDVAKLAHLYIPNSGRPAKARPTRTNRERAPQRQVAV